MKTNKTVILKNERTFSSSTTFGICIFFANRKVIFLTFASNETTDETTYSKRKNKSRNKNNKTCEEYVGKQVEKMLHDAILVRCGLSIAGSKFYRSTFACTPNRSFGMYIFLCSRRSQRRRERLFFFFRTASHQPH